MIDEKYLQKSAVSIRRVCRSRQDGNLCKGIVAFMVVGLRYLSLFKPFQKSHLTDSG